MTKVYKKKKLNREDIKDPMCPMCGIKLTNTYIFCEECWRKIRNEEEPYDKI